MNSKRKEKLLLAVGERTLEDFLRKNLKDEFEFTKEASYREIVIKRIEDERPNVVLIREALKGSMSIENLVLDIREEFPEIRIVFYTSRSRPGEPLLRKLVSYGVYDFISGETVTESQIFDGLLNPKQLSDVRQYLEAPTFESHEPHMYVKSEYKDLTEHVEQQSTETVKPKSEKKDAKDESSDKKKQKGFFSRLFGKNKDSEDEVYRVEEVVEDEVINEPIKAEQKKETNKSQYDNPLGLFGSGSQQDERVESQPTEEVKSDSSTENNDIELEDNPDIDIGLDIIEDYYPSDKPSPIDETESIEEDLFSSGEQTNKESSERLVIEPRGKSEANSLSLHQRTREDFGDLLEDMEDEDIGPNIDFNPNEFDLPPNSTSNNPEYIGARNHSDDVVSNPKKEKSRTGRLFSSKRSEIQINNNKIVTFVSSVHGVGNTHVAFNTALTLADNGNKVLYIDLNSTFSSVDFSFQLGTWQQGIDKALEDIVYNSGMNVSDHILRINKIKEDRKNDKQLLNLYKKLPDTLDYMFYSLDYQTLENQHSVPKERLRDLIMYIVTKEQYDAIIIDSEPLGSSGVDGLLNLSNKIYITMTQDPGQMGVFHRQFDAVNNRVDITDNVNIVVNQFVDVEPSIKRIQNWTDENVLQTIPFTHKSVILANFLGEPFVLNTKHKNAILAFDKLAEHIAE